MDVLYDTLDFVRAISVDDNGYTIYLLISISQYT